MRYSSALWAAARRRGGAAPCRCSSDADHRRAPTDALTPTGPGPSGKDLLLSLDAQRRRTRSRNRPLGQQTREVLTLCKLSALPTAEAVLTVVGEQANEPAISRNDSPAWRRRIISILAASPKRHLRSVMCPALLVGNWGGSHLPASARGRTHSHQPENLFSKSASRTPAAQPRYLVCGHRRTRSHSTSPPQGSATAHCRSRDPRCNASTCISRPLGRPPTMLLPRQPELPR